MLCRTCGAAIRAGTRFCPNCGAPADYAVPPLRAAFARAKENLVFEPTLLSES